MTNQSPIRIAVEPQRQDAIEAARQAAQKTVDWVKAEVEANGWDMQRAAPYPRGISAHNKDYIPARDRHQFFWRFVKSVPGGGFRVSSPQPVEWRQDRADQYVEDAAKAADAAYESFVLKLENKIGEVTSASLDGNHVWSHSILTVEKADGTVENWKTQGIINVSKLGKLFNQFPTRKLKG